MAATMPDASSAALRLRSESRPPMAKADLRKAENPTGQAITQARNSLGWSLKEFSGHARRGERQLARWEEGTEHPQLDTLFAIVVFREPLIIALAKHAGLGVRTTITIPEAA